MIASLILLLAAMPPFALFAALRVGANTAAISHRRYRPRAPGWWRRRRDRFFCSTRFLSAPSGSYPAKNHAYFNHMTPIAWLALVVFSLPAVFFAIKQRSEIALLLVLISMIPIGLCLIEGGSRMAPAFSLAGAARFLNSHLGERGQVLYEGPLHHGSTLTFYLNQKFFLVNQEPDFFDQSEAARGKYLDEHFVLESWDRSDPLYLIIHEDRVPHWQDLITTRVHIYHQVTTCGPYVVLSNQL